jgi:hypothetical protein
MWRKYCRLAGCPCILNPRKSLTRRRHRIAPSSYDLEVIDAKHMLERVATLKQGMQDLRAANARLDEPRWKKGSHEARLSRLEEIKLELTEMLYEFKRTGTD